MGRFSLTDDDDDGEQHCWEFVANPGEEGALVISEIATDNANWESSSRRLHHHGNCSTLFSREEMDMTDYTGTYIPRQRTFMGRLWNASIAIIIAGWLFQRYLPPGPPPALINILGEESINEVIPSWKEFLSHHSLHLIQSSVALTVQVPLHLSQWLFLTLSTDFHLVYERYREFSSNCQLRDTPAETTNILHDFIAGQNTAIRIVVDTVETWQLGSKRSPLLLLFTGFPNTGKTTMAHALIEHVLLDTRKPCSDPLKRILVVQGHDFSESTAAQNDVLMNQIVRHVNAYSSGSMILIQQIEDMAPDLFEWLARTLFALSSGTSSINDVISENRWNDCCPNTVFIFTSNTVGRNSIARALRQGNLHHTDASFLADLIHDVDLHFDQQKFHSRSWLDAIVPFQPFTRESLGDALSLKVSQLKNADGSVPWNEIVITEDAKDVILDPTRVEYLEWKRRDRATDDPVLFMTVAFDGAQILDEKSSPLWKQLLSTMNRCFLPVFQSKMSLGGPETAKIDYSEGDIIFKRCYDDPGSAQICHDVCTFSL